LTDDFDKNTCFRPRQSPAFAVGVLSCLAEQRRRDYKYKRRKRRDGIKQAQPAPRQPRARPRALSRFQGFVGSKGNNGRVSRYSKFTRRNIGRDALSIRNGGDSRGDGAISKRFNKKHFHQSTSVEYEEAVDYLAQVLTQAPSSPIPGGYFSHSYTFLNDIPIIIQPRHPF
jgi:hypothetical protein